MTYYTERNMTLLNVALQVHELYRLGKVNFFVCVDVGRANNSLLDGAVRGVFPSREPNAMQAALRELTEQTPLGEQAEADVLLWLVKLSEGRLRKETT